jgi:hypothetical protein
MRKFPALLATGVAAVAVAVAATPAAAQFVQPETTFTFDGKVTPKKAGTKKKPKGVKLTGQVKFTTVTQGVEPPIIVGSDILLPKTGAWNGGKYKTCSLAVLKRKGPSGCDKKAIIGKASGVALADTVDAKPRVTIVNGGKSKFYGYTVLYHPTLVKEPVVVKIKKLRGGPWGYKVSFRVPENLQIVAGVPITLRNLKFQIGGTKAAKNIITTTGCKGGKHPFEVETFYRYQDESRASFKLQDSVACTK